MTKNYILILKNNNNNNNNNNNKKRMIMIIKNRKITVVIFSRRFPVSFDVCFSVDPIKFDFRKGPGSM